MSRYIVKEIFYTLQGEGARMGRPSVFCRFAGCNLWSGLDVDRATAVCGFCDTDFVGADGPGGGKFETPEELAFAIVEAWPPEHKNEVRPYVVFTGGEPLLQLDEALIGELHAQGFEVAIETNGTRPAPRSLDWICVSPKAHAPLVQTSGDELKLVYPQVGLSPHQFEGMDFGTLYLSPMSGPALVENTQAAVRYCLEHPQWRLTIQMHKIVGVP
jgi:7-carboxy-7-deazaguanine synthase (Cx14CxxC type)